MIGNKVKYQLAFILSILIALLTPIHGGSGDKVVTIKLGTLAPEGTVFHDVILRTANAWHDASNGKVKLRIYAGGIAGSEPDMIRKMKIGQLHAASITSLGVFLLDPAYTVLQLPGMVDSPEELEFCLKGISPIIEERLLKKGYIVLNYCDLGPIYFYTTKKVTSVSELMKMKICTFATDRHSKGLWSKAGFTIVDLNSSEVLAGLQTGLIDGFIHSPIFALSMQWFAKARYMVNVKYGYGLATTVVKKKQWDKIEQELKKKLIEIAHSETEKTLNEVRELDTKAINVMKKHGLEIFKPDEKNVHEWIYPVEKVYPQIRGSLIPAEIFDRAMELKDEYRSRKTN